MNIKAIYTMPEFKKAVAEMRKKNRYPEANRRDR